MTDQIEIAPDEMPRADAPRFATIEWEGESASFGGRIVAARYFPNPNLPTSHIVFRAKSGGPNFFLAAPIQGLTFSTPQEAQLSLLWAADFGDVEPLFLERFRRNAWGRFWQCEPNLAILLGANGLGSWHKRDEKGHWSAKDGCGAFRWGEIDEITALQAASEWQTLLNSIAKQECDFAREWFFWDDEKRHATYETLEKSPVLALETVRRQVQIAAWSDEKFAALLPMEVCWHHESRWFTVSSAARRIKKLEDKFLQRLRPLVKRQKLESSHPTQFLCVRNAGFGARFSFVIEQPSAHQKLEAMLEWQQKRALKTAL